jgi:hypothetical protein
MTKDALSGPYMIERLAEAAAKVGDRDCAVEQLQILVTNPTRISASILRVDPLWGRTLSGHPGFRRLLRPQA